MQNLQLCTKVSTLSTLSRAKNCTKKEFKNIWKGGQQRLLLYVNLSISQPPVDRFNSNIACRAQMGSSSFWWFFVLTLFGQHEVKLPLPMFLRQEASNLASPMYLALNLMVSGLKNRGRCNFTSCQANRVNTQKNYLRKLDPICALHAKF